MISKPGVELTGWLSLINDGERDLFFRPGHGDGRMETSKMRNLSPGGGRVCLDAFAYDGGLDRTVVASAAEAFVKVYGQQALVDELLGKPAKKGNR